MEGNRNGNEAKQEYQHKDKSVIENGRKDEGKNAYGGKLRVDTPLGVWFLLDCVGGLPLESSQLTQDKT